VLWLPPYAGHAAAQALGDGVDERGRPSHPGPAGDLVKWCLGRCASTILGGETSACPSRVYVTGAPPEQQTA
jgi:hypothetical protein